MARISWLVLAVVGLLGLGGCAFGNTYNYAQWSPSLEQKGSGAVGLGVQDRRGYVVSKDKKPDFVGIQRGGFGNPFNVRTTSGKPLSADWTEAIETGLRGAGYEVKEATIEPAASDAEARGAVQGAGGRVGLCFTIDEWKTDALVHAELHYNVTVRVLDRSGAVKAEKHIGGTDKLGAAGSPGQVGDMMAKVFPAKVQELLQDPGVSAAMR